MNKKRNLILLIISIVLLLATMVAIFIFSCQNAEQSSETSNGVVETVIDVVVPDFDDLAKEEQSKIKNDFSFSIRNLAHFSEFAALGFFAILHLIIVGLFKQKKIKYAYIISLSFSLLYALSDEIHQLFSDGRAFEISDVLTDFSGSILGIAVIFVISLFFKKKEASNKLIKEQI